MLQEFNTIKKCPECDHNTVAKLFFNTKTNKYGLAKTMCLKCTWNIEHQVPNNKHIIM